MLLESMGELNTMFKRLSTPCVNTVYNPPVPPVGGNEKATRRWLGGELYGKYENVAMFWLRAMGRAAPVRRVDKRKMLCPYDARLLGSLPLARSSVTEALRRAVSLQREIRT